MKRLDSLKSEFLEPDAFGNFVILKRKSLRLEFTHYFGSEIRRVKLRVNTELFRICGPLISSFPQTVCFSNHWKFRFSLHCWKVASMVDINTHFGTYAVWDVEQNMRILRFLEDVLPARMPMGCMQSSYFLYASCIKNVLCFSTLRHA